MIGRAEIPTPVLLVTLVYIYRSRPHLSVEAEEWALHRVFLGALMLASKVSILSHSQTRSRVFHPEAKANFPDPFDPTFLSQTVHE